MLVSMPAILLPCLSLGSKCVNGYEKGRQWCQRIWTVIATCAKQGKSVHAFLREAVGNWFEGEPAPSLL